MRKYLVHCITVVLTFVFSMINGSVYHLEYAVLIALKLVKLGGNVRSSAGGFSHIQRLQYKD